MKPIEQSTTTRKRTKQKTAASKQVYREHQLMRRLLRYSDRQRVLKFLDVRRVEDFPNEFVSWGEGNVAVKVTVDWRGIQAGLEKFIDTLAEGRSAHVTTETLAEVKKFRSREAAFYVLEFLPEAIDSALNSLYLEAYTKVSVDLNRPWARTGAEILCKIDYERRLQRLGLHEGRKSRFRHRSEYESVLKKAMSDVLASGRTITQGTVAEELGRETKDAIDVRVIRRWNEEFGVNWKELVNKQSKRTNLS